MELHRMWRWALLYSDWSFWAGRVCGMCSRTVHDPPTRQFGKSKTREVDGLCFIQGTISCAFLPPIPSRRTLE